MITSPQESDHTLPTFPLLTARQESTGTDIDRCIYHSFPDEETSGFWINAHLFCRKRDFWEHHVFLLMHMFFVGKGLLG